MAVCVGVVVLVGLAISVSVGVGVDVFVGVIVSVGVLVSVLVMVIVGVMVRVRVCVGVGVMVGVLAMVGVALGWAGTSVFSWAGSVAIGVPAWIGTSVAWAICVCWAWMVCAAAVFNRSTWEVGVSRLGKLQPVRAMAIIKTNKKMNIDFFITFLLVRTPIPLFMHNLGVTNYTTICYKFKTFCG